MTDVVDFAARRLERHPHRSGLARCLNCGHVWTAVAPVGATQLDCPSCSTSQGVYAGLAQTEEPQFRCRCLEFVFFLDARGAYCAHCGTRPEGYQLR